MHIDFSGTGPEVEGKRIYVATDGTKHKMSLTTTCMGCHTSQENFCARCHDYSGVDPYCWDCHQKPRGDE